MRKYTWQEIYDITDSYILDEVLKREEDPVIVCYAAQNPNCSPESFIEILRKGKDDHISGWCANNSKCPSEALAEVLRMGKDDYVSHSAAMNLNCPSEALIDVLRRGNNDYVSHMVARNPNCPPEAALKWYEVTGQLVKYDPERFELEHNGEDKDLEELRKLMG